jgi:hypothetical protein
VFAPNWSSAAPHVCNGREAPLIRTIARRLEQLETRAKEVAVDREPDTICFIEPVNKRVSSTLTWESGKSVWRHYDPPRERAEFGPIAWRALRPKLATDIGY